MRLKKIKYRNRLRFNKDVTYLVTCGGHTTPYGVVTKDNLDDMLLALDNDAVRYCKEMNSNSNIKRYDVRYQCITHSITDNRTSPPSKRYTNRIDCYYKITYVEPMFPATESLSDKKYKEYWSMDDNWIKSDIYYFKEMKDFKVFI